MIPPLDTAPFSADAIDPATAALNAQIIERLASWDMWSMPAEEVRRLRRSGEGPFPVAPKSERARWEEIDGPAGKIPIRVFDPGNARGVYLHIHGGGWMVGGADEQDSRLDRFVDQCNLAVVSVEYRLAPEAPYPAAPDDCEAAALWLVANAGARFGTDTLFIGGESAGAQLSVATLLRLRDRHGVTPFSGANLNAGCFDMAMTPSARRFGLERLVLNTRDIEMFRQRFIAHGEDMGDPDISPIHADLTGLPPALFTVGTRDPLLDDSLFMSARWAAAGNRAELAVYPGGAHVFINFPSDMATRAFERIEGFLNGL